MPPRPIKGIETLEALEPFLTDDEALSIGIIRGAACNHPFVTAHAGLARTARGWQLYSFGGRKSEGRVQSLEYTPVVRCRRRVLVLRG